MRNTGIIRKMDGLGRIVLPIELRRTLDISDKDELEILLSDDCIVLRKYEPTCIFCGAGESLVTYREKKVCKSCLQCLTKK